MRNKLVELQSSYEEISYIPKLPPTCFGMCLSTETLNELPNFCNMVQRSFGITFKNHTTVKIGGWALAWKWALAQSNMVVSEHYSGDISLCRYICNFLSVYIYVHVTIEARVKWIIVVP